jgi:hypothetical protein
MEIKTEGDKYRERQREIETERDREIQRDRETVWSTF